MSSVTVPITARSLQQVAKCTFATAVRYHINCHGFRNDDAQHVWQVGRHRYKQWAEPERDVFIHTHRNIYKDRPAGE